MYIGYKLIGYYAEVLLLLNIEYYYAPLHWNSWRMVHSLLTRINLNSGFYFYVFQAGVQVADPVQQVFNGQEIEVWPRITWKPKWATTFKDVKSKVGGSCSISQKSTLVIKGRNIFVKDLSLDGALVIDAADDKEV